MHSRAKAAITEPRRPKPKPSLLCMWRVVLCVHFLRVKSQVPVPLKVTALLLQLCKPGWLEVVIPPNKNPTVGVRTTHDCRLLTLEYTDQVGWQAP